MQLSRFMGGRTSRDSLAGKRKWLITREYLFLFIVLACTILLSIKPWRSFFFTGLGEHWDTQLMGEWMAWNAHNILNGKIFLPDFNANYFYPHSLSLAFGEMLWPQSFVYAALYGPTHNPFFAFNGTMLFFWALAGVCMYALLRELTISRAVAVLGSFIFCMLPLAMMYYIEFNMLLFFILPLMLFLLVRWLRRPSPVTALLLGLGCIISVTSSIYYTNMVAFPMLSVFVVYLVHNRSLLTDRKFLWTLGIMGVAVIVVTALFLYPYALLKVQGGYARDMNDFMISHAQPLMYLDTRSSALFTFLFTPETRWSETYLFPGSVLAILSLIYFLTQPGFLLDRMSQGKQWLSLCIVIVKTLLWLTFWFIVIYSIGPRGLPRITRMAPLLYPVSLAILMAYVFGMFVRRDGSETTVLVSGLAVGAVICFFISLGPFITIGLDDRLIKLAHGPFYALFEQTDVFSVVRGLTRFAAVVMVYLIVGSCLMLQRLVAFDKRLIWMFPLLLFFLFFEARQMKYRYADYTNLVDSPVIQQTQELPEQSVLFQIPTTPKVVAAHSVLNTIGDFHLSVNGYSGFVPKFSADIKGLVRDWRIAEVTRRLSEIWPTVFIIVDRPSVKWLSAGWKKPFPWDVLNSSWELMSSDNEYSLYRLKRRVLTSNRLVRLVRTDVLRKNPILQFKATATGGQAEGGKILFHVLLNGKEVTRKPLGRQWREYRIVLPEKQMWNLKGDEVVIELLPTKKPIDQSPRQGQWRVSDITFTVPAADEKSVSYSGK